ncbi:hypothetical protein ES703_97580 [subsurface metagenome]
MTGAKKRYDSKYKVTRIHLGDYLALKRISQLAGTSMAEALHRLIEHQAQLPLFDRIARPVSVIATQPQPFIAARVPVIPNAAARIKSTNVKLRVTVAKGGSSNGAKQV